MDIWVHVLASALLALFLWPFFGPFALLVFVGGVLVDSDHLLWYYARKRKISFSGAYHYCRDIGLKADFKEYRGAVMIFHSFDTLLVLLFVSLWLSFFMPVLAGLLLHLLLDLVQIYRQFGKLLFFELFSKSAVVFLFRLMNGKKF